MQTTLRLQETTYRRAKARAAELGISLTRFLEEALLARLDQPSPATPRGLIRLRVSRSRGGLVAGFGTLADAVAAADLAADRRQGR